MSAHRQGADAGKIPLGRWARILLFPGLLTLGLVLGRSGGAILAHLPPCQFHQLTGWHCAGCGGTRAFQALARADVGRALRMNPFGTVVIVGVALLVLRVSLAAAFPNRRWPQLHINDRFAWGFVALLLAFTLLRNLPWWPFTLLAPI